MASAAPETAAKSAVEKTNITMEDGRVVAFTSKQRLNKESTIGADGSVSGRFDFRNGKTVSFTIPADLLTRFAAHGMEQKLGDSVAGEKDIDDAFESMSDLAARLSNGDWTAPRQAGSFTGQSTLLKALVELSAGQKSVDDLKVWLGTKSQAEKIALRRDERLKPIIERIEAEKAANSKDKVDTASLLGELDGLGSVATSGKGGRKAATEEVTG